VLNKTHLKEILSNLIETGKFQAYTKNDIEKAIMKARGIDRRTIINWFNAIFDLGYILPVGPNRYDLNIKLVSELDMKIAFIPKTDSGSYG
jgi:hypothetical protein